MEITKEMMEYLSAVMPGNNAIYRVTDKGFETLFLSPDIPKLNGMTSEEYENFTGGHGINMVLPPDRKGLIAAVTKAVKNNEQLVYNYRVFHKSLGFDWVRVNAKKCGEIDGDPVMLVSYTNASVETDCYRSILENMKSVAFVTECGSDEVLFANLAAKSYGNTSEEDLVGRKCYEHMHGRDRKCEPCLVGDLPRGAKKSWVRYNEENCAWERITVEHINRYGHDSIVQYIDDITESREKQAELSYTLEAEEVLLKAVQLLNGEGSYGSRVSSALKEVGEAFNADRTYAFKLANGRLYNTYEWCRDGVEPQIDVLQDVDVSYIDRWMKTFDSGESLIVPNVEDIRMEKPDEYEIMTMQGIHSYIEAPIIIDGVFSGFIGADNPDGDRIRHAGDIILSLTYAISNVIIRYENEKKLQGHADELETIIANIPVGISMMRISDGKTVKSVLNPVITEMLDMNSEGKGGTGSENDSFALDSENITDSIDGFIKDRINCEDVASVTSSMKNLIKPGNIIKTQYRYSKKGEDKPRWYDMHSRSVRSGDDTLVLSCLLDVTADRTAELEIDRIHQMYADATKIAKLIVWTYDEKTHCAGMMWSGYTREVCKRLGVPSVISGVPGSLASYVDSGSRQDFIDMYDRMDSGETSASCVFWFKLDTMQTLQCEEVTCRSFYDRDGNRVGIYCVGQNITARKLNEEKYNNMYKRLASSNPYSLGSFQFNLTQNSCGYGQSKAESLMSLQKDGTADEILKANAELIIDPKLKAELSERLNCRSLISEFRQGRNELSVEYPIKGGDGLIWVQGIINMIENPLTGDVEGIATAINITDRKTEESIINCITSENYDYIGLINIESRTLEFKKKGLEFAVIEPDVNYDYEEAIREIIDSRVRPEDKEMFAEAASLDRLTAVMRKNKNDEFVFCSIDDNGNVRRKRVQFSWLDQSERVILCTQSDITVVYEREMEQLRTMQEAMKAAESANIAKSEFLSRMSHDIRTPLNGIIGMTYLAAEEDNPPATEDYLVKIDTSSKFLLGLVNDVLDMSKAESGKIELHPEPYREDDFIEYIQSVIKPLCNAKSQRLAIEIDKDNEYFPLVDKLRINQIFLNILSNASKYTPAGGTISYRLKEMVTGKDRILLHSEISDNGIGMSEEFQKTLFDPFTQENRDDTAIDRGSGLGLAIVRRMVDLMGGTIAVSSKLNEGTTFIIEIETEAVTEEAVAAGKYDLPAGDRVNVAGMHILLCEDHPMNQAITKKLLEKQGAIVHIASDGEKGVAAFRSSPEGYFDMVLMDIRMPVLDGYETAIEIRSMSRRDAATVPIIAMTADAFDEDVRKCLKVGMNDHIAKPVDPDRLYQTIARYGKAGVRT